MVCPVLFEGCRCSQVLLGREHVFLSFSTRGAYLDIWFTLALWDLSINVVSAVRFHIVA